MKITAKDLSTIQRMLGIIEGASYNTDGVSIVGEAVATIYEVLDSFKVVKEGEQK